MLINFIWTPGHCGIYGNEAARNKTSSQWDRLPRYLQKQLPFSTSAAKCAYAKTLRERAKREWSSSERHARIARLDPRAEHQPWSIHKENEKLHQGANGTDHTDEDKPYPTQPLLASYSLLTPLFAPDAPAPRKRYTTTSWNAQLTTYPGGDSKRSTTG